MTTVLGSRTVVPPENSGAELDRLESVVRAAPEDGRPAVLRGPGGDEVELPEDVYGLLREVVSAMHRGMAITVAPHHKMLTTQEAADLLGVSRPTLVKLLESGEIQFSLVGRHRRIRITDLLEYQQRARDAREAGLDEMAAAGQDAGLYDAEALHRLPRE